MITLSFSYLSLPVSTIIDSNTLYPERPAGHGYNPNPKDRGVGGYTAKTLQPGEKLVVDTSTLINNCDKPMEVWYFGPADVEADIRPKDDFDLIYTIPDAPYFQYVFYELNHGQNSCFTLFESTQVLSDTHFLLARINQEQLTEIEKKWQKPDQVKSETSQS